jgi:hypothetical protein
VEECFGGPIVQGQGLAPMHRQLSENQFVEYPMQGLCVVADALVGAVCGRLAT